MAADHLNIAYTIQGREVVLVDGVAENEAAPGSALKNVTRYFGNEAQGDLNGDGREDVVFLLTHETGGSGTFFYAAAALGADTGFAGSEAVLLGDRIAPQSTMIRDDGVIVVNYAERAPGEPMTAAPSIGKSLWLKLDPTTLRLGEVVQDFPGEADPARMSLETTQWVWQRTRYADGREIAPRQAGAFTLTFSADGTVAVGTDCNRMTGGYTMSGSDLAFGTFAATKMFCADSQENDFAGMLDATERYAFTSRGELVLELEGGGTAVFR